MLVYPKLLAAALPNHFLSFEKADDWGNVAEPKRLARYILASGIAGHPQRYHKRTTAIVTAWNIANGMRLGLWLVLHQRLRIVHARSYVSSVMPRLLIQSERGRRVALEAARRLGVDVGVFLLGFVKVSSDDYQQGDLHGLSSKGWGLPAIIIASEAGTLVVTTARPLGPREILSVRQFGRLVPVGNSLALAAAMAESLAATHDTAALKARAQDFSIDKAVDQYEALLFPGQDRFKRVSGHVE